jgi:glucose-1-phosphate adenylyltransferase
VIENSVIGVRAQIGENAVVRNTYVMGGDFYEQSRHVTANARAHRPNIGIGAEAQIENAIIDKNARIGRGVKILNEAGLVDSEDAPHYLIRDGIVVIPKFTILQDGTAI